MNEFRDFAIKLLLEIKEMFIEDELYSGKRIHEYIDNMIDKLTK